MLVWEEKPEDTKYEEQVAKRRTYLKELLEAGLECEEDEDTRGIALRSVLYSSVTNPPTQFSPTQINVCKS